MIYIIIIVVITALIVKIKHLSFMENSKISENNYVNGYKASLKGQIKSLNGEIIFLRQELREKNVPAKCKCIASTVDDTEFHNINKSSNNNHNKN